jgi:hypothetical protein
VPSEKQLPCGYAAPSRLAQGRIQGMMFDFSHRRNSLISYSGANRANRTKRTDNWQPNFFDVWLHTAHAIGGDCCGRTYSTEKVNLEPGEGIRQGWVNQERSAHTLDGKKKDGSQARDPDRQSSPRPRQTRRLGRSSQIAISNCRRSRRPWLNVSSRPV